MRFSYIVALGLLAAFVFAVYGFLLPVRLTEETQVELPYNTSVTKSADILHDAGIIRRKEAYVILAKVLYPDGIVAGKYAFNGETSVFSVIYRVANGKFGRNQIRLTIPEGFTVVEIAARIKNLFPNIDEAAIKDLLKDKEGYIYPETYFFDSSVSTEELVTDLVRRSNLELEQILAPHEIESAEAKRIIIVASLLESEGRTEDERRMIAGIIENRLKRNMPLQLDATLTYITGRSSKELTLSDLKLNSPYNTYVYRGLPPGPISNPGEESIRAAMQPIENDYLFYLHADSGQIYYAKTFDEHVKNKQRYLR